MEKYKSVKLSLGLYNEIKKLSKMYGLRSPQQLIKFLVEEEKEILYQMLLQEKIDKENTGRYVDRSGIPDCDDESEYL